MPLSAWEDIRHMDCTCVAELQSVCVAPAVNALYKTQDVGPANKLVLLTSATPLCGL